MNADDLKKLTTDSLDRLAGLLDVGHSDQLAALPNTIARFHRIGCGPARDGGGECGHALCC